MNNTSNVSKQMKFLTFYKMAMKNHYLKHEGTSTSPNVFFFAVVSGALLAELIVHADCCHFILYNLSCSTITYFLHA